MNEVNQQMNFNEYKTWIVEFSKQYNVPEDNKCELYLAGIGEEWGEYFDEMLRNQNRKLKELGDVLAYTVLTADYLLVDLNTNIDLSDTTTIDGIQLQILGYLKRHFRGDANPHVRKQLVVMSWKKLLEELELLTIYTESNIDLQTIININVEKLTQRQANNTLRGSGSER